MARDTEDNFQVTKGFASYVSKPEITDLNPKYLTRGSKNVIIDYAQRVVSRNGYTLFGAAGTGSGVKGSYEWNTSTAKQFPMRSNDDVIKFYWNGAWNTLMTGLPSPYLEFAKIWDNTEKIDVLLWVLGSTNTYKWSGGATTVRSSTATTLTKQGVLVEATIAFTASPTPGTVAATITDSAANFVLAGFVAGDVLTVTGSTSNNRNFTIGSVVADTITLVMSDTLVTEIAGPSITVHTGEPTWARSRFLTTGTRKILYNGVEYAYTGGESTATLTGLTAFPAVTPGDAVWQTVVILANSGDIDAQFRQDLIGVQQNQLILASTQSQQIYVSSTTDYTDFALVTPRIPGSPAKLTMDNYCTCIVSVDNADGTPSALMFGGGTSDFFRLSYYLSQDNANELVRMTKLKTASGAGPIAKSAIGAIKNTTAYISHEPSLETLGAVQNVDGRQNTPISDDIKDDFDSYNFTNSHVKYWRRNIFIALPSHGIVLIYDLQRRLWQPPQTLPVARFAIINDELYGHSNVTDETYKLFDGTNDNGAPITQVARFAYNNGGRRDRIKNMSEYWTDGYITVNGILTMRQNFGYGGSEGQKVMTIRGNDPDIVDPQTGSTIGDEPLGVNPLGGAAFASISGLPGVSATLKRFYQADTMNLVDYVEQYVEYTMSDIDAQFAIVAHGSNQIDAGTSIISHKK